MSEELVGQLAQRSGLRLHGHMPVEGLETRQGHRCPLKHTRRKMQDTRNSVGGCHHSHIVSFHTYTRYSISLKPQIHPLTHQLSHFFCGGEVQSTQVLHFQHSTVLQSDIHASQYQVLCRLNQANSIEWQLIRVDRSRQYTCRYKTPSKHRAKHITHSPLQIDHECHRIESLIAAFVVVLHVPTPAAADHRAQSPPRSGNSHCSVLSLPNSLMMNWKFELLRECNQIQSKPAVAWR